MFGSAFGILIVLVLAGSPGLKSIRPLAFSVAGSLAGVVIFLITQNWWPPIVGPFILCPALAAASSVLGRKNP